MYSPLLSYLRHFNFFSVSFQLWHETIESIERLDPLILVGKSIYIFLITSSMKVINVEIFEKVHSKPYITRMHASRILWILYLRQQNNLKHKYLDLGLKKSLPLDLDGPILYSNWCRDLKIWSSTWWFCIQTLAHL